MQNFHALAFLLWRSGHNEATWGQKLRVLCRFPWIEVGVQFVVSPHF